MISSASVVQHDNVAWQITRPWNSRRPARRRARRPARRPIDPEHDDCPNERGETLEQPPDTEQRESRPATLDDRAARSEQQAVEVSGLHDLVAERSKPLANASLNANATLTTP
jgi:hypothetical protein